MPFRNIYLYYSYVINERAKAILQFCFVETPMNQWFKKDEDFDGTLKNNFMHDYIKATDNELDSWKNNPEECVALIMLLDQFSRNFFRDDAKAYKQDKKSRNIVKEAVSKDYLYRLNEDKIHFLLLPLIHSEDIKDHIFGHNLVDKFLKNHLDYEKIKKAWNDHTVAIKKFGRYPHRNKILNRDTTDKEKLFLKQPDSSW